MADYLHTITRVFSAFREIHDDPPMQDPEITDYVRRVFAPGGYRDNLRELERTDAGVRVPLGYIGRYVMHFDVQEIEDIPGVVSIEILGDKPFELLYITVK